MTRHANPAKEGGVKPTVMAVLLATGLALVALAGVFAAQAKAAVGQAVGPIVPAHGFPFWYQDSNGLKLELCIDGPPLCLAGLPNPASPARVADDPALSNFPDEAFWWTGEASIDTLPNGQARQGRALLVLAREAAFGGADGAVRDGDQVSFSRVRIRVQNLRVGAQYTITHPYGAKTLVAEDDGSGTNTGVVNFTEDVGCALSPNPAAPGCDFSDAFFGRVDPFLIWNPAVVPAPPKGYVGDPNVGHGVVGSPNGTNFFRVAGPDAGGKGTGVNVIQTNRFFVQGKLAGRAPTALTLNANPARVRPGQGVALSGNLSSFGRSLGGRTVVLQRRAAGASSFTNFGRRTTNVNGFFVIRGIKPAHDTVYRAAFLGQGATADQPTGVMASFSTQKKVTIIR